MFQAVQALREGAELLLSDILVGPNSTILADSNVFRPLVRFTGAMLRDRPISIGNG